jgi:hypothetical protein
MGYGPLSYGGGKSVKGQLAMKKIAIARLTVVGLVLLAAASAARAQPAAPHTYNIDAFLEMVPEWIAQFSTGPGPGDFAYLPRMARTDLYGSADVFFLLYTLDMLDLTDPERAEWATTLAKFQDKKTGWFIERSTLHPKEHATAYAVGAIKLLVNRAPRYPLAFRDRLDTRQALYGMLENDVPWEGIWSGSHIPTGMASALINTGQASGEWLDWLFTWLDREADPDTGYWIRGAAAQKGAFTKEEMGGAFHFYFLYTFTGRPLPYPEKIIDATLSIQNPNGLWDADLPYCIDLDGVFALIEAHKQIPGGYRNADVQAALAKTTEAITGRLNDRAFVFKNYKESHKLVGAVAALAEIQAFSPGLLQTPRPLKSVLAASPFI